VQSSRFAEPPRLKAVEVPCPPFNRAAQSFRPFDGGQLGYPPTSDRNISAH